MKPLILALLLASQASAELPVNLPSSLHQENWGPDDDGSCTHAAMVYLLHWQGQHDLAQWWRKSHVGGETPGELHAKLDAAGIRYAATVEDRDVSFLELAVATRRGCGVKVTVPPYRYCATCRETHGGSHMVLLVNLTATHVTLLDVNDMQHTRVPLEVFLANWLNAGSWAVTPVYSPAAPLPRWE